VDVREAINGHHRRCATALANLQLLVTGENDTVLGAAAVQDMDQAMRLVSDELSAAEKRVVEALADTNRALSAAQLLGARLARLHVAAQDVAGAVNTRDVTWLRRSMTRFQVLSRAACEVQLDVYVSALASGRPAMAVQMSRAGGRRVRAVLTKD
jgi:hypothetical protein